MSNRIEDNILILDEFIEVRQNLGKFVVCPIKASHLLKISKPFPRGYDKEADAFVGIQRTIDNQKISELKQYIYTEDACFPNSIITNLDTSFLEKFTDEEIRIKIVDEDEPESRAIFIIDGQHRVESFRGENIKEEFDLLVAIFFGLSIEEQAFLFSTINNKQKKLNSSLVQDLNDLFTLETPEKIVHVLTKLFNSQKNSPWYNKIKILGKNVENEEGKTDGIMSQYSFAKEIIKLIYGGGQTYFSLRNILKKNGKRESINNHDEFKDYSKKYMLWDKYVNSEEDRIYKSLLIYFSVIQEQFPNEWGEKKYILNKTTGYIALMRFYKYLYERNNNFMKKEEISDIFKKIKDSGKLKELTSKEYPSGVKGQKELYDDLVEGTK